MRDLILNEYHSQATYRCYFHTSLGLSESLLLAPLNIIGTTNHSYTTFLISTSYRTCKPHRPPLAPCTNNNVLTLNLVRNGLPHPPSKSIARRNFSHVITKSFELILSSCSPNIHVRFGGSHALGGERHDIHALRRWFGRLGRLGTMVYTVSIDFTFTFR